MSGKIRSKDLAYDASLPPFLQRLRNQHAGNEDAERLERQGARARKVKDANNDDDGPTVVDENGELMSRGEFEERAAAADKADTKKDVVQNEEKEIPRRVEQTVTTGLASKKRKAVKMVTEDGQIKEDEAQADDIKAVKKTKKKPKPIKLAFAEDDG